jgi:osmotically-inducible protein OsmY
VTNLTHQSSQREGSSVSTVREEAIAQIVRARLHSDVRTCAQTIDIIVHGDLVELLGVCDTEEQRVAARTIVLGTNGVRDVCDRLRLRRVFALAA